MPTPSVQYTKSSAATMKLTFPVVTRTAVPPDLGTDQIPTPSKVRRPKKTLVELSARANRFVPTLTASVCSSNSNAAVREVSLCTTSWQDDAVPLQAPPQPMKRADCTAEAVKVTEVPCASVAVQAVAPFPQDSPAPVTWPGPEVATERFT